MVRLIDFVVSYLSIKQPLRGLLPISLLDEQMHDGCEQFA